MDSESNGLGIEWTPNQMNIGSETGSASNGLGVEWVWHGTDETPNERHAGLMQLRINGLRIERTPNRMDSESNGCDCKPTQL